MSTTNVYNDPTMAANVTTAKEEGKHELDNAEKEYFLRDIEEKNLDPFCMNTKKQVWDKKVEFYGEPGSSRRIWNRDEKFSVDDLEDRKFSVDSLRNSVGLCSYSYSVKYE